MRVKHLATTIAVATIGAAAPLSAQRWPTVEVGAFAKYTMFGDVLQLDDAPGFGGMVGLFILPNLVAEGDVAFASTDGPLSGSITYRPVHARLAYHIPLGDKFRLALGAGYTLGNYHGDPTPNEYEDAAGGLVGLKYYFKPSWAINVEALFDKFPSPANQEPKDDKGYWNNSIRAGVNWIYPSLEKCAVTIDPPTATITQGDSRTFTAVAREERSGRACEGPITFTSTDDSISPAGIYTAGTPGSATVTASYRGKGKSAAATANVNVNRRAVVVIPPPCVNSIDLRPDTATVLRGETVQLTVSARTCAGADTTMAITYSGGNVSPSGLFTAGNDTGVVQITATATVGGRPVTDVANIRVLRHALDGRELRPELRGARRRVARPGGSGARFAALQRARDNSHRGPRRHDSAGVTGCCGVTPLQRAPVARASRQRDGVHAVAGRRSLALRAEDPRLQLLLAGDPAPRADGL